jgi:tRNA A37 threonylcarbamoyladenosine synthetase subunit TsaC/SUA5/YrdC
MTAPVLEPTAETVDVAVAPGQVGDGVDYTLDGGPQGTTTASTSLDLSGDPEMRRHSNITAGDLDEAAGLEL